jgi:hypothetical protein
MQDSWETFDMGLPVIEIFAARLGDHFWWLLGVLFMIEPWLDAHVEKYKNFADQFISRQLRARLAWTVSIVCLFIAGAWAFSDEYWSHQGDLKVFYRTSGSYEAEKQRADNLQAAIDGAGGYKDQIKSLKSQPPTVTTRSVDRPVFVPSGGSSFQRSKFAPDLQKMYAQGTELVRGAVHMNITDDQIDAVGLTAGHWADITAAWIEKNMSREAAERFLAPSRSPGLSYDLPGTHKPEEKEKRENAINAINNWLANLEVLMSSTQWDPQ